MVMGNDYPFSAYDYFFWVPIIGPIAGAIWGSALYYLLIGR
jgi:glycerol uptake facilitator-like aquaporin